MWCPHRLRKSRLQHQLWRRMSLRQWRMSHDRCIRQHHRALAFFRLLGPWPVQGPCPCVLPGPDKPGAVDAHGHDILGSQDIVSGDYGRVSLNAYAYDQAGNKGVSYGLNNIILSDVWSVDIDFDYWIS